MMTHLLRWTVGTTAVAALALAGCLQVRREAPDKHLYALDVERPAGALRAEPVHPLALAVRGLRAAPRFAGRNLVYRRGDQEFVVDYYNEFLVAPAALVSGETERWLARSNLFRHVFGAAAPTPPDVVLTGQIEELYGDFRGAPRAVLAIRIFLVDERPTWPAVLLSRSYERSLPAEGSEPAALVAAWNAALAEILAELERDLAAVDLAPPASATAQAGPEATERQSR
ncbi:MAG TPA: ABC-type transport auxiliary lipoprotein family protein [Planctomycetota bacterium]|nr:ABC-type transport auxiliary lipoprotein family protein [Planctomycetota bacterium]